MLVRLLVDVDISSVVPNYGLEKEKKKQYSLILSAMIFLNEVLTQ